MNKKQMIAAGVLAATLTLSAGAAFAETPGTTPTDTTTSSQNSAVKIDKDDPRYVQIADLNKQRQTMNDQEEALVASVKAENDKLKALREQIKGTKSSGNKEALAALNDQKKQLAAQAATLRESKIAATRALADAVSSKDKAAVSAARASLDSINTQIKAIESQVKALSEQIKSSAGTNKGYADELKKLSTDLRALDSQVESLHVDILRLRADKDQQWISFEQALRAGDLDTALSSMQTLLSVKTQITAKFQSILTLRQQAETMMNDFIAAHPATPVQ